MRIYREIRRRRETGSDNPLAELLWRVRSLTDHIGGPIDLTDARNREAFSDVLDAYIPGDFELVLLPSGPYPCVANLEAGGRISFYGLLTSDQTAAARFARTLWLAHGFAEHHLFRVVPRFRDNKIAPRSLIKSVAFYDSLGLSEIRLRAMWSGCWYWAQWGFHFANVSDLIRLQQHTQEIVNRFGADFDVSTFVHPMQFFYLGDGVEITFHDLIDAFPEKSDAYEGIAHDNGISLHKQIPFSRAVLLTGPSWDGSLNLAKDEPDRLIFDDLAKRMVL